jgi:uncharacterized membrane protein SpoIIM required for sporulation
MQKILEVLKQSLETSRKMKKLLLLVAIIYIITYLIGYLMIRSQTPFAIELSELITENISTNPIFAPLIGALESKNLAFAIAYTFLINLSSGAFASTTLPGVIPFIGGIWSIVVTGFRGFMIGVLFTYATVSDPVSTGIGWRILAAGTAILELGAYVFSAVAGINISLSTIYPSKYQVESRWIAFKEAWKDAGRLYVIVIILLALGAVWEMTGIYLSIP